jgi:hypothetical protein
LIVAASLLKTPILQRFSKARKHFHSWAEGEAGLDPAAPSNSGCS